VGVLPVEEDCFLEAVEIGDAIWTAIDMFLYLPALGCVELLIEILADVPEHITAFYGPASHDVMY